MGFKTLTIQKYSAEIWNALASFRKEFGLFTKLLAKTQKKVSEVSNTIDEATRKTVRIEKNLNKVTQIAGPEIDLIENIESIVDDNDDNDYDDYNADNDFDDED